MSGSQLQLPGPPLFKVAARIGSINVDFVVCTGASISILPLHLSGGLLLNLTAVRLSSADGSGIACHGEANVKLLYYSTTSDGPL